MFNSISFTFARAAKFRIKFPGNAENAVPERCGPES
jgi:hypothetical protein